jgi:hypothetical protein
MNTNELTATIQQLIKEASRDASMRLILADALEDAGDKRAEWVRDLSVTFVTHLGDICEPSDSATLSFNPRDWEWKGFRPIEDVTDDVSWCNQRDYGDYSEGEWYVENDATRTIYYGSFRNYNSPFCSGYTYAKRFATEPEYQEALAKWQAYPEWIETDDVELVDDDDNGLDSFTEAYIECALWSTPDLDQEGNSAGNLDDKYGESDIAPATLASMREDCADFLQANRVDIGDRYAQAGHDFWLTRNRHGAGFWDGDWNTEASERLTEASHAYGPVDLTVGDDRLIY